MASEQPLKLVVLHTNDLHSHFERMPQVAAVLDRLRARHAPEEVLTLDIGDHLDRMRVETEASLGMANVDVLNACGYEAAVLGNNEGLTYPRTVLETSYVRLRFPVLGSNLRSHPSGELPGWMVPSRIVEKNGLRVGLIGVTAYFPDFYRLIGWEVLPPLPVAAELARELRPKVDVLIVLSHLGLNQDRRLAEEVAGIDLILGGHTHHLLERPERIGNTYIAAAGKFGQYVGEVVLEYDPLRRAIARADGRCVAVDDAPPSPEIAALIAEHRLAGKRKMAAEVVRLAEPMPVDWYRESPMGNLLAAGLRRWTEAEIGLVNAGQILEGLDAGAVSRERLLDICPSPINPCRMNLTGRHLLQALEEALLDEFTQKPIRGFGFRGERLGTLCLDNVEVKYRPQGDPLAKIVEVRVGGRPLDPERVYRIGTIDMFTFGIGYLSIREGTEVSYYLPEFLRDVLADQLARPQELARSRFHRWTETTDSGE